MKKYLSLLFVCALVLTFAGCSKPCEDLELSRDSITFTKEGQTKGLNVKTDPRDTTDTEAVIAGDAMVRKRSSAPPATKIMPCPPGSAGGLFLCLNEEIILAFFL